MREYSRKIIEDVFGFSEAKRRRNDALNHPRLCENIISTQNIKSVLAIVVVPKMFVGLRRLVKGRMMVIKAFNKIKNQLRFVPLKNKICCLLLVLFLLISIIFVYMPYNVRFVGGYSLWIVIMEFACFLVCKHPISSPSFLFLSLVNLFHLGLSIACFLDGGSSSASYLYSNTLAHSPLVTDSSIEIAYSLSIMVSLIISLCLLAAPIKTYCSDRFNVPLSRESVDRKAFFIETIIGLCFSAPCYFFIQFSQWKAYRQTGSYLAVYSISAPGYIQLAGGFFYLVSLMFLIFGLNSPKKFLWYGFFLFFVLCLAQSALKGTRFDSVVFGILLLYLFFRKLETEKQKKFFKVMLFLLFFLSVPVLSFISVHRNYGGFSLQSFLAFLAAEGLPGLFNKFLIEFGGTIKSVYLAVEYIPSYSSYLYGLTYAIGLLSIYPNTFNLLGNLTNFYSFVHFFPSGTQRALGGSVIGEAYSNFGFVGTLFFFVLMGVLIRRVDKLYFETKASNNPIWVFACYFLMLFLITWVRGYFMTEIFHAFIVFGGFFLIRAFLLRFGGRPHVESEFLRV